MKNSINKIGEIEFMRIVIPVFYDKHTLENKPTCSWQSRNPSSFYQGSIFMNDDGGISYPKDAVIPKQTKEDRELIPKFIICGVKKITEDFKRKTLEYLTKQYKHKNNRNNYTK
jgi:hypothetical protein